MELNPSLSFQSFCFSELVELCNALLASQRSSQQRLLEMQQHVLLLRSRIDSLTFDSFDSTPATDLDDDTCMDRLERSIGSLSESCSFKKRRDNSSTRCSKRKKKIEKRKSVSCSSFSTFPLFPSENLYLSMIKSKAPTETSKQTEPNKTKLD